MIQPASAGTNTLTRVGPYGGSVSKVVFHPTNSSIAYATTTAGFYRSTDGGQSWQIVNDRIFNTARDITVHPAQPDRVFVVTSGFGVLASNDAGATLSVLSSSTGIYASGVDVEYSADGSVVYVSTGRQVYRSTDQGTTWLRGGDIPVGQSLAENLIVDPTDSNRLYMAREPGQGFQSADGGVTWQSWSVPNVYINDLAIVDIQQPVPRIWAATTTGIRFSDDRGVSWTIARTGITATVTVDPDDPTIVYAGAFEGLLRSEDNGANWSNIQGDAFNGYIQSLAIDPANSDRLLLAGQAGLARSDDGGAHWVSSQTGIDSLSSLELVSSPASDRIYINAYSDSIYALSPDDGTTTSFPHLRQLAGHRGLQSLGLTVLPGAPDRLFVAAEGKLWRSLDSGETWSSHTVSTTHGLYRVVNASADGSKLLGAAADRLFSSADGGDTWTELPALGANDLRLIVSAPSNPQVIYLPGRQPGATRDVMLKSSDGGNTWTTLAFPGTDVIAIAVDPSNEQTLYTGGTLGEVFKSTNGGQSWTSINVPGRYAQIGYGFWSLAIDPRNTNIVYAGGGSFMARSVDGGATWQQLWFDEDRFLDSRTAVVDPLRPHSLYVGISGNGVREFSVQPDLRIAEIASDVVGTAGSYSYRISNAGPFDATNVRARIQLPRGSTNITATSAGTTCTVADTVVTCAAPIFRTDGSADITIEAIHTVAGELSVVGTIEGDQPDAATADNTVTSNGSSTEMTDLSVTLTAPAFVTRGEQISLALRVNNAGPNEAAFVSIRLELGAGLNIANVTLSGGTSTPTPDAMGTCVIAGNTLSCRLPQLPSGGSYTIGIVTSATTAAGSFGHIALVEGSGKDLGLRNNSASAATTVNDIYQAVSDGGNSGGGGSTSPFMIAALLLLSCMRAAANKFQRSIRSPLF